MLRECTSQPIHLPFPTHRQDGRERRRPSVLRDVRDQAYSQRAKGHMQRVELQPRIEDLLDEEPDECTPTEV